MSVSPDGPLMDDVSPSFSIKTASHSVASTGLELMGILQP